MYYKLTDQAMRTHEDFQWFFGEWYSIKKGNRGRGLCTKSWFHCYTDPLLAVIFNPVHADIPNPRLFQCRVRGKRLIKEGDKAGFTHMMIPAGSELDLPEVSITQRVAFGILCAKQVCKDADWNAWADAWLSGADRSKEAAWVAEAAAWATNVAWAAAKAARVATEVVCRAARAAAWAAAGAARTAAELKPLDLAAIAKQAMRYGDIH